MPILDPNNRGESGNVHAEAALLHYVPLDKTSFIPLPAQILAQLQGMIRAGKLAEGDAVPGEEELSHAYGVSRPAARQALELLRNQGYVVRKKGRGTFVTRPKVEKNIAQVAGFSTEMERLGIVAGARVLSAGRRAAGGDVAMRLAIFRGTPVFTLRRLRLADGIPIAIADLHIEPQLLPQVVCLDQRIFSRRGRGIGCHHDAETLRPQLPAMNDIENDRSAVDGQPPFLDPHGRGHFIAAGLANLEIRLQVDVLGRHLR